VFPFDLPGPEFLVFYLATTITFVVVAIFWRWGREAAPIPKLSSLDPCLLAYLRGGEAETIRCVILSLVDRGLLIAHGLEVRRAGDAEPDQARRPIERAILTRCASPVEAHALLREPALAAECRGFREELTTAGLLPDAAVRARRRMMALSLVPPYLAIGVTKAFIGVGRDRPIELLVVLMVGGVTIIVGACVLSRRTRVGDRFLADVHTFLSPLKSRAASIQPGGADADFALLVGAFGVAVLPDKAFGAARDLFPKAAQADSGGSSCGTSCGGGGCGGGGGGGCGGCGGD
jgi:uncharacterized protein (TIGR04222 family)